MHHLSIDCIHHRCNVTSMIRGHGSFLHIYSPLEDTARHRLVHRAQPAPQLPFHQRFTDVAQYTFTPFKLSTFSKRTATDSTIYTAILRPRWRIQNHELGATKGSHCPKWSGNEGIAALESSTFISAHHQRQCDIIKLSILELRR